MARQLARVDAGDGDDAVLGEVRVERLLGAPVRGDGARVAEDEPRDVRAPVDRLGVGALMPTFPISGAVIVTSCPCRRDR